VHLITIGFLPLNPIILWFFTKIRFLDRPQEPELEVVYSKEVIEVETQEI